MNSSKLSKEENITRHLKFLWRLCFISWLIKEGPKDNLRARQKMDKPTYMAISRTWTRRNMTHVVHIKLKTNIQLWAMRSTQKNRSYISGGPEEKAVPVSSVIPRIFEAEKVNSLFFFLKLLSKLTGKFPSSCVKRIFHIGRKDVVFTV